MGPCACGSRAPMQIIVGTYLVKPDSIVKRQESIKPGQRVVRVAAAGVGALVKLQGSQTKCRAPGETPWMGKSSSNQLMTTDGGLKAVAPFSWMQVCAASLGHCSVYPSSM